MITHYFKKQTYIEKIFVGLCLGSGRIKGGPNLNVFNVQMCTTFQFCILSRIYIASFSHDLIRIL